ncbi:MAG TPA: ATP-binding cassette domain-containing protein [Chromatiales bacterium]|nr:ATP-binding cassette domain-containing protein [Chromatiales bacterium]
MSMQGFELRGVSVVRSGFALHDISVALPAGQHTALLGPSGCGKTTVLRLLSGLDAPACGEIWLNGQRVSQAGRVCLPPHQRGIAMVFQDLALWPGLTAIENILLGLSGRGLQGQDARSRAREALAVCQIGELADRLPARMSGGQQQRVALARAIAVRPEFLFLDEPFGGLDLVTRKALLGDIASLACEHGFTIVLVTHDPLEVRSLCSHAIVLESGSICEAGELDVLLADPKSVTLRAW